MQFSILHVSDLHRDLTEEVDSQWLLESLAQDFEQYQVQNPIIMEPRVCIVSGDLVYGIKPNAAGVEEEMERQYAQAEEFLVGLANRFFDGDRERIVVLPGNHDVCYDDVMKSAQRIDIPDEPQKKKELTQELFATNSFLRWSWDELCFYRITDHDRYRNRFGYFARTYERFYNGRRTFSLDPEQQFSVFDFSELGFSVITLNSCYNNDPLHRAGAIHPNAITEARRALVHTDRSGWLTAVAWHHNLVGGPNQDDYMDAQLLQLFIDAGASLGFHGHQHLSECIEERYTLGLNSRKITIISAGTLCAGARYLPPGEPRSYNIVELDTDAWKGRVHQRKMVNRLLGLPIWGPGHFNITNSSYIDFEISTPLIPRPANLDLQLELDRADELIGSHQWREAVEVLEKMKDAPLARPLLVKALSELDDAQRMISALWPPATNAEGVLIGGAILDIGPREQAEAFLQLEFVSSSDDASVRDISNRIRERWLR
jgi:hypothetical protein